MNTYLALLALSLSVVIIQARLFQFEDVLVDPTQDRDSSQINDWGYRHSRPAKRNSMCLINAGLSQGCDLSDILMAKQQASKFMSFAGPGRR
ncbi:hypothetical protein Y032_0018g3523 [Ancylostoma ceylanicum]|uniref:Uncharacterized protein n=1 Tax=Ancylostoma ceylanicum TaxID=53326 RepID=A0A016V4W2_9BILA|nr:hypothetical protein Y032_0018g3523 [Ancylostoma ceylanicum]